MREHPEVIPRGVQRLIKFVAAPIPLGRIRPYHETVLGVPGDHDVLSSSPASLAAHSYGRKKRAGIVKSFPTGRNLAHFLIDAALAYVLG